MKNLGLNIISKVFLLLLLTFLFNYNTNAQNAVSVKIFGLKVGDTCTVQIQKSAENFQFKN